MQESTEFGWRSVCEWHGALWASPVQNSCVNFSFQIADSNSAFISNLSIISPYKEGEVNKDTSTRKKTLDINPFIFLRGSAAVSSVLSCTSLSSIRVRGLVEPRAPEGCCSGRLEQHKEASNSPSGKAPTGAQAMAMPSVFC